MSTNPTPEQDTLHAALTRGIERAIADFGAELSGAQPAVLTGRIIQELREAGFNMAAQQSVPVDQFLKIRADLVTQAVEQVQQKWDERQAANNFRAELCKAVGLPLDATEAQIVTSVRQAAMRAIPGPVTFQKRTDA